MNNRLNELVRRALTVVLTVAMVTTQSPLAYATEAMDSTLDVDLATLERDTPTDELIERTTEDLDGEVPMPAAVESESAAAAAQEPGTVAVGLSIPHASLRYIDSAEPSATVDVPEDTTSVTVPAHQDFRFEVVPADGYELEAVVVVTFANGVEDDAKAEPDGDGRYTLTEVSLAQSPSIVASTTKEQTDEPTAEAADLAQALTQDSEPSITPSDDAAPAAPSVDEGTMGLSFSHAYIVYAMQDLKAPTTSVNVAPDEDFTFEAAPDEGYELSSVSVVDAQGTALELGKNADDTYTVPKELAASGVTLSVVATSTSAQAQSTGPASVQIENTDGTTDSRPEVTLTVSLADGTTVELRAPEGALPEGVSMEAELKPNNAAVRNALADLALQEGKALTDLKVIGITLFDADGMETEPALPVRVVITGANLSVDDGGAVEVLHVDDETGDLTKVATSMAADSQTFSATSFSDYVVAATSELETQPTLIGSDNAQVSFALYRSSADRLANKELDASTPITIGDTIYGLLSFEFRDGCEPNPRNLLFYYEIPDALDVMDRAQADLLTNDGEVAGSWWISNNVVWFSYNEDWAREHDHVDGSFGFDFTLTEQVYETGDVVKLLFPGATTSFTLTLREGDVVGKKEAKVLDDGTGEILYTVNLHAQQKFTNFAYKDVLDARLEFVSGSFQLDGATLPEVTIAEQDDGTQMAQFPANMTIPAGDHVVTYRVRPRAFTVDAMTYGGVVSRLANSATWSYGSPVKVQISSTTTDLRGYFIKKSGARQGDVITWTVVLNESGYRANLKDFVFTDELQSPGEQEYTGNLVVRDYLNKVVYDAPLDAGKDSFSYVFEGGAARRYTLTYQTRVTKTDQLTGIKNKATIESPTGGSWSASAMVVFSPYGGSGEANLQLSKYVLDRDNGEHENLTMSGEELSRWFLQYAQGRDYHDNPAKLNELMSKGQLQGYPITWRVYINSDAYPDTGFTLTDSFYHLQGDGVKDMAHLWFWWSFQSHMRAYYVDDTGAMVPLEWGNKADFYADGVGLKTLRWVDGDRTRDCVMNTVVHFNVTDTYLTIAKNHYPIVLEYDTICDGTDMTYSNKAQVQWGSGKDRKTADASAQVSVQHDSRVEKAGKVVYDEDEKRWVADWTVYVNRSDDNLPLADLAATDLTLSDLLPAGMSLKPGSVRAEFHRVADEGMGVDAWDTSAYEAETSEVAETSGTDLRNRLTIRYNLAEPKVRDDGSVDALAREADNGVYTSKTWAKITFRTYFDPAYVGRGKQGYIISENGVIYHRIRNSITATAGGLELGTGNVMVHYRGGDQLISKVGEKTGDETVHYTIEVNPNSERLNPYTSAMVIRLNDTLDGNTSVVPGSPHVLDLDHDKADITDQCAMAADEDATDANGQPTTSFTLSLPDETHLSIGYDVTVTDNDDDPNNKMEVTNVATLEGIASTETASKQQFVINNATARTNGIAKVIEVTKRGPDDELLAGATFELYKVDDLAALPEGDAYDAAALKEHATKVYEATTGEDGVAVLYEWKNPAAASGEKALTKDTLYYFVETQAPEGYDLDDEPHFVMLKGSGYDAQRALALARGIKPSALKAQTVTDQLKDVPEEPQDAVANICVTKRLVGRDWADDDEFVVELAAKTAGAPLPDETTLALTAGEHEDVSFGDTVYAEPGTYDYTVTERAGDVDGLAYDVAAHAVRVTVSEDDEGRLSAQVSYERAGASAVEVTNAYHATGEAHVRVKKTLSGRLWNPREDEFSFVLEPLSADAPVPSADGAVATTDRRGIAAFGAIPLSLDEQGGEVEYLYRVREVVPDEARNEAGTRYVDATPAERAAGGFALGGVAYDSEERTVVVTARDNGDGTVAAVARMAGDAADAAGDEGDAGAGDEGDGASDTVTIPVQNTYQPESVAVSLTARKELEGPRELEAGRFHFELSDEDGTVLDTATNDADGAVTFAGLDKLTFAKTGTYAFVIRETIPALASEQGVLDGMRYDRSAHTATVTVADDRHGQLEATVAYADEDGAAEDEPVFVNEFVGVDVQIEAEKHYLGNDANATFDFVLVETDADGGLLNPVVEQRATSDVLDADGVAQVRFAPMTFVELGEWHYLLYEDVPEDAGGQGRDRAVYRVTVRVDESFRADVSYELLAADGTTTPAEKATFYNNELVSLGFRSLGLVALRTQGHGASVVPTVRKTLENGQLVRGGFVFELRDESGALLQTATNDAEGVAAFGRMTFTEPGTYRYTINEQLGTNGTVVYDDAVLGYEVVVREDADGTLAVAETYTDADGGSTDEPTFANKVRTIVVRAQKRSREAPYDPLEGSTYGMWMVNPGGNDVYLGNDVSDADGYLYYDVPTTLGVAYYLLEEAAPHGHLVDPYPTDYFTLALDEHGYRMVYQSDPEFANLVG